MPGIAAPVSPCQTAQAELAELVSVLSKAGKKAPPAPRVEALEQFSAIIAKDDFKVYEPFAVTEVLPTLLKRFDDKPPVAKQALATGLELVEKLSVQAFPFALPVLFTELEEDSKWKPKLGACRLLHAFINKVEKMDRDLLSACLPELVPVLSHLLHDTKQEIAEEGEATLTDAMKGITNRDLEPFTADLIKAIKNRDETTETINRLGGVVFVQTVEGSALSVVVPLMMAGFRFGAAKSKRLCARIIGNMSKLVEEPLEAAPFLEELIPGLAGAIDTIADPEARDVATKTHANLEKIQTAAKAALVTKAARNPTVIADLLKAKVGAPDSLDVPLAYVATIAGSLIRTRTSDQGEWKDELSPYLAILDNEGAWEFLLEEAKKVMTLDADEEVEEDDGTELCDCEFTLAYGTKILLHNAKMKLKKGKKYGLLGQNDCGKTTLMRAIADGSVDGFPDESEVRTVFVEADIQGELSHLDCVNYVLEYAPIKAMGATEKQVRDVLKSVGFSEGKAAGAGGDCDDPISSLSGGWRMKLALARAMLQSADILLMDEPTNHLDVKNVKWVESYINSLTDTTVIMVSHDSGLLDNCCDYIVQIDKLKLGTYKGNLSQFVETHPEAKSFFEFKASKFTFKFPQPSFLEGVKSRGKALLKMDGVTFTYPGNTVPTISDITVRASMASRVACVGVNGAGKSTMIKVLTGELEPQQGTIYKFPNSRIGYIAQHAFQHIESHLDRTPNEYIRWRFEYGDDKEGLDKASMKINDSDQKEIQKEVEYSFKMPDGAVKKSKRRVQRLTGNRRESPVKKKVLEYEVSWKNMGQDANSWLEAGMLTKWSRVFEKVIKIIDARIAARENIAARPLTEKNVEEHINNVGLEPEYATHSRISTLSGGQKVKVVLAAAMWDQPHILILDEPTNYLDRDSLGALADAITLYEGGIIMITHNDAFCRQLCPERWVLEAGKLNTEGDVEWMAKAAEQAVEFERVEEMVDASGNKLQIKKKLNAKEKKKKMKEIKQKIKDGEELDEEEEDYAIEWNL
jgi:elongation factor 3